MAKAGPLAAFLPWTAIFVPSGITTAAFSIRRTKVTYPWVLHALGDPGQQALMMNSVKKFGQVEINHRLISVLQVSRCFGDGGVSARALGGNRDCWDGRSARRSAPMTWSNRLLNRPVHDIRNAKPPLPAPGLWQPDPADIAGPVAFRQQITAQTGDDRRGFRLRRLDRLPVHSRRSLVAHYVQQRPGQIGFGRCFFEQPTGVGRAGVGTCSSSCASLYAAESFAARMRPRARPSRPPKGCRRTRSSIAVVPSFSIHLLLCSTGFHRLPRYYEEIRLLRGRRPVVVASFGSTARADPRRSPWVRSLDVPPLPPPLPPRPRLDFGRRVRRHADPAGPACTGVHFRSVLRFASGFFPTRPHGASVIGVSRRRTLRAVASGSRLLPTRPAKDFHLQSSAHARHTSRRRIKIAKPRSQHNPAGNPLKFRGALFRQPGPALFAGKLRPFLTNYIFDFNNSTQLL